MRAIFCVLGFLVCAYKGVKLPFAALTHKRERRMFEHWFGFADYRLNYVYANISEARWRDKPHHLTDLIVEWNRLDAQRGAKAFSALGVIPWLIILLTWRH